MHKHETDRSATSASYKENTKMRPRPGGTAPEAAVLWTVDKCVVNLSNSELNQHEEETMLRVSFDVKSLFTNVPVGDANN